MPECFHFGLRVRVAELSRMMNKDFGLHQEGELDVEDVEAEDPVGWVESVAPPERVEVLAKYIAFN